MSQNNSVERIAEIYNQLGTGEQAQLRRGEIGEPLWRVLAYIGEEDCHVEKIEKWQLLIELIAQTGHADVRLGAALRHAEVQPRRVDRMLDADSEQLPRQLRSVASQLESVGQPVSWDAARKLLFWSEEYADQARIKISRQFYAADMTED